ncbi:MAG TPA: anion permease [Candidatus Collinsella stercoripullorum]|nr:anion permease [Candidatus Collinsella stercoripullorum]
MCIFQLDEPAEIFYAWTGTTMWLVIGAYLIANAVQTSGLGERIAYSYMLRFVTGFKSIIVGIFALTAILSLLIPHPWPRAFLIMAVMAVIIKSSGISAGAPSRSALPSSPPLCPARSSSSRATR